MSGEFWYPPPMNRIVRTHYPVEKLPEDLRAGLTAGAHVTITIAADDPTSPANTAHEAFNQMVEARDRLTIQSEGDSAERIRKLRDEWDD
jgi:hypothetical protein